MDEEFFLLFPARNLPFQHIFNGHIKGGKIMGPRDTKPKIHTDVQAHMRQVKKKLTENNQ